MPSGHRRLDDATREQLKRARQQRLPYEKPWAIADAFFHGRQNVHYSAIDNNRLVEYPQRRAQGNGAIQYRQVRNRLRPIIAGLVSKYNSRMPGWMVTPDSGDPVAIANARTSEHALTSYYESLGLARQFNEVLTLMANLGEGYADVYWDPRAGAQLPDGSNVGDVAIRTIRPDAMLWEAGLRFEESGWHAIEQAFPASYVKDRYGIKDPSPDAVSNGSMIDNYLVGRSGEANMVLVVERYERPANGKKGSRQTIIGESVVEEEAYPYTGENFTEVSTQPWVVRYSHDPSPTQDRDLGIGVDLSELNRAYNTTINQQARNKDLRSNPPMKALKGSYKGTTEPIPGHLYEYNDPDAAPELMAFEDVSNSCEGYLQRIEADMQSISGLSAVGSGDVPSNVDSAGQTQALIQQDDSIRAARTRALAQSHAAVGLRILLLLRAFATDDKRMLRYTGKAGIDGITMFKGSQIPKSLEVKVSPGSIEAKSRQQIENMAMSFAQQGWIDPRIAMTAIDAGTTENLFDQFELDISWQERENRRMAQVVDTPQLAAALEQDAAIRAAYDQARLRAEQMKALDPTVPVPDAPPPSGPWPHAREFDNHKIHLDTLNTYRKSEQFDLLPENVKEVFQRHAEEHEAFMARESARQFSEQQAQAIEYGQANAARPTRERQTPNSPAPQLN